MKFKMSHCRVQLDHSNGIFGSGDTISGKVFCLFRKEKNIRGIKVKIIGKEHTHWTKTETHNNERRTVDYTGDNKFFHYELKLAQEGTMNAGTYEYPFSYMLPNNIPSSFHNEYGSIEYGVEASVDIPWKSDYKSVVLFHVQSSRTVEDIYGTLQNPVQWSDAKSLWCLWCKRGPITLNLHINKSVFVPGEAIKARIDCTNLSSINISEVQVEVLRKVTSKAKHPYPEQKTKNEVIAKRSDKGIGAHGEGTYEIDLFIPVACRIYNFQSSELFTEETSVRAVAVVKGCHSNLETGGGVVLLPTTADPRYPTEIVPTTMSFDPQNSFGIQIGHVISLPTAPPLPSEHAPPTYAEAIASDPVYPPHKRF